MPHYRRQRHRMSDMNVVPYIDIMLVLLIIFMITSPLLTRSVDVELPTVKKAENVIPKEQQLIIVTINAQKQLFLDDDKQPLSTSELLIRVAALIRFAKDSQVLIRGDRRLAYGEMVNIISLLQEAGVQKVGLLTQPWSFPDK